MINQINRWFRDCVTTLFFKVSYRDGKFAGFKRAENVIWGRLSGAKCTCKTKVKTHQMHCWLVLWDTTRKALDRAKEQL